MQNSELFDLLMADANHPFAAWDFSHISATGRMVEAPLSWSYASKLLMPLRRAQSLLDMGTGGGEFLSSLQPLPLRSNHSGSSASKSWKTNTHPFWVI